MAAGDLPADTDIADIASYFDAVIRGIALKAGDGASRKTLAKIAARAMRSWPSDA